MANIIITDELLALFAEGRTTIEESAAILAAAKDNLDIRYYLESAMADGVFFNADIAKNASSRSVCKLYRLNSKHLPVMRLAASGIANDCVVKCEKYVLERFGRSSEYTRLYSEARRNDWLRKDGTPLYHIGRLSELAQLSVSRQFKGTTEAVLTELNGGCAVIAVLNTDRLKNPYARTASACDHAVVVLDINTEEDYIELYDPLSSNPTDRYAIDTFLRAWKMSRNYFVSIVERGVRPYTPHPEYVANIKLPAEIEALADMLAENAHNIWAADRLKEADEKTDKAEKATPWDNPFMKPFYELSAKQRKTDYLSSLNTIKLLYKLGFVIIVPDNLQAEYKANERTPDGKYIPDPINVEDIVLPKEIEELTEYIAENTHEEWAKQRMKEGWTFAPETDKALKQSFDLVPYCELLDSEKDYDRKMALNTLKVLYKLGCKIEKSNG